MQRKALSEAEAEARQAETARGEAAALLGIAPEASVQAKGDLAGKNTDDIHEAAARGVSGSGQKLPHLERLQEAFGPEADLSGVQAHVGGAAAQAAHAMHANAYATGNHVAFAATPDLGLAAHEAAHVVQQREGVQLSGGIGRAGDEYERHADAVADQVVRGDSAEALLDPMTQPGTAPGREVQRQIDDQAPRSGEQQTDSAGADGDENATGLGANVSSDPIINRIAEVHPDGITIVLYAEHPITGDEEVDKNNREFVTQGRGAGQRYQAMSASGDQLILGQGIPFHSRTDISQNVSHVYTTLRARYQATRAEGAEDEPRFLRANRLTIFCHGSEQRLALPGADLTTSNMDAFVNDIRDALHPGVNVQLFACNAANGDDSLAAVMAGALGEEASVFGHTTTAHTTENAQARVFGAAAGNQPEGQHMRDIMFPPAFVEAEMTRIWGTVAEGERERLRSMLGARVERFYQSAAGLRGGWNNEVRQSMQGETAGEGNVYSRHSMFGREMFMNPDRARDIAQRHFVQWVASHIREFEVLHPVTEAARNGAAASGSAPSATPASAESQASDAEVRAEQPAISTPAVTGSAAPPATGSPAEFAAETGDEPADSSAARPLLRMGSRGDAVQEAQRLLNTHGAQIAENGEFESSTRAAVVAFQRRSSLAVDGIIGEHTWAALNGETSTVGMPAATSSTRDEPAAIEQDAEGDSRSGPAELSEENPAAATFEPEDQGEAGALAAIRQQLPEVVAAEPGLRDYDATLTAETRARYRIPERGWTDTRAADGATRRIDLSHSLRTIVERVRQDPAVLQHIRETLDMFYNDPDPRSRLRPEDIDLPLVLAIACRESGRSTDFLSTSSRRVVTAGRDTHAAGVGGLDYAGDRRSEFPSQIRDQVTRVQDDPRLRAGLRANRQHANPAEVRERDLLAAYIVEVRHREQRFERLCRRAAADFLNPEQTEALLARLSTDARRAWTQASFGSRLPQMLRDVLGRFRRAMQARGFDAALVDDQVNLNAVINDDRVMEAAGLSGHRTRITTAEASMLDQTLGGSP